MTIHMLSYVDVAIQHSHFLYSNVYCRRVLIIDYYDGVKGCDPYLHKGMSIPR